MIAKKKQALRTLPRWSASLCLLQWSRPLAVAFAIPKIVVDSIDAFTFRSIAHIFEKYGIVIPLFTDRDTSSTPVFISWASRVKTSLAHILPRRISSATAMAVLSYDLFSITTARNAISLSKVKPSNPSDIAAFATTFPVSVANILNHCPPAKYLISKVKFNWSFTWHNVVDLRSLHLESKPK